MDSRMKKKATERKKKSKRKRRTTAKKERTQQKLQETFDDWEYSKIIQINIFFHLWMKKWTELLSWAHTSQNHYLSIRRFMEWKEERVKKVSGKKNHHFNKCGCLFGWFRLGDRQLEMILKIHARYDIMTFEDNRNRRLEMNTGWNFFK